MAVKGKIEIIHPDWCKACGICIYVCPTDVFALVSDKIVIEKGDNCIGCGNCELSCPDFVLKVVDDDG